MNKNKAERERRADEMVRFLLDVNDATPTLSAMLPKNATQIVLVSLHRCPIDGGRVQSVLAEFGLKDAADVLLTRLARAGLVEAPPVDWGGWKLLPRGIAAAEAIEGRLGIMNITKIQDVADEIGGANRVQELFERHRARIYDRFGGTRQ